MTFSLASAIDLIVSSPLKRALTTAQEIARYIGYPEENIVLQRDAMERFRGDLEGRPSWEQDGMTDEEFAAHAKGMTWQQIDSLPNAHVFPIEFSNL